MTTYRRANPSYLLTNKSRTIPVPQLMTMAPKSGVQHCNRRGDTCGFRRVKYKQVTAALVTSMKIMNGMGVFKNGIRIFETMLRRKSAVRSPRHEAMGGAILSLILHQAHNT